MDVRGKRRKKKTILRARNQLAQNRFERAFRPGAPYSLDVGRIGKQQRDAFLAERREGFGIEFLPINRSLIDLEIAAMNDDAGGGANRERDRIGRRMRDSQWLDRKRAEREVLARLDRMQILLGAVHAGFFEAAANECQRDRAAINRDWEFAQQVRKRADMILVRMGQNDRIDGNALFAELGKIGNVDAVAEEALLGKHHAAIDDQTVPCAFEHHQVEADLPQTAKGKQLYGSFGITCPHRHLHRRDAGSVYKVGSGGESSTICRV